jgi:hypothetical protein
MKAVEKYYVERGYPPMNITMTARSEEDFRLLTSLYPTNYIPFAEYWRKYTSSRCSSADENGDVRYVYLATDAIESVRSEITSLTSSEGADYWVHCNKRIEFVFNSREEHAKHIHTSLQTTREAQEEGVSALTTHRHFENVVGDGYDRYMRTVTALADMHILSQRLVLMIFVYMLASDLQSLISLQYRFL